MTISNYAEDRILRAVLDNTSFSVAAVYVSLHDGDPGETGANEISGGSYARQSAAFSQVSNDTWDNDAAIDFTDMPSQTGADSVDHVALWDAASGGNCLWTSSGQSAMGDEVSAGETYRIAAGDLSVTLD